MYEPIYDYNPSLPVPLNRPRAMVFGLMAGAVGALAMQAYWRLLSPSAFQTVSHSDEPVDVLRKLPGLPVLVRRRRTASTASTAAVGELVYERVTGRDIRGDAEQNRLRNAVILLWGIAMGGAYGLTRTTTRWRDIAGSIFYGLRLAVGDAVALSLLGLRPDPRKLPLRTHLIWLTGHWVYSFVTTNLTRVLYRSLR